MCRHVCSKNDEEYTAYKDEKPVIERELDYFVDHKNKNQLKKMKADR
jgi:hypothetical protein